jgi:hypothetical protein
MPVPRVRRRIFRGPGCYSTCEFGGAQNSAFVCLISPNFCFMPSLCNIRVAGQRRINVAQYLEQADEEIRNSGKAI